MDLLAFGMAAGSLREVRVATAVCDAPPRRRVAGLLASVELMRLLVRGELG